LTAAAGTGTCLRIVGGVQVQPIGTRRAFEAAVEQIAERIRGGELVKSVIEARRLFEPSVA
jgi:hypothetical protein